VATSASILSRAALGWNADQPDIPLAVINRLREKLRAEMEVIDSGHNHATVVASFSSVRLRGANDVACFLITGEEKEAEAAARQFWRSVGGPEQLVLVLALSEDAARSAASALPADFFCVFGPSDLASLLDSSDPLALLKNKLREQVPWRRLMPFITKHAVHGNMFYGRRNEIQRLIDEDTENFAIAGQGRIGKSSLVAEYVQRLRKKRDPRVEAYAFCDFYTCQPKSETAIVQFLGKAIGGVTSQSVNLTLEGLEPFLRRRAHQIGRPLDLLLEEVDMVCDSQTFKVLAHISKRAHGPIARLVLLGRGELLRAAYDEYSPLGKHVQLMRLEPLDEESARRLLIEPLADMGVGFSDEQLVLAMILRLTGRLPQLLQYFGAKLAKLALEQGCRTISQRHVEIVRLDMETVRMFTSPLEDIKDPLAEMVALLLLERGIHRVDEYVVMDVVRSTDIQVQEPRSRKICDDLLLANFLSWTKTGLHIANEAMGLRVRETDYLVPAMDRARKRVQQRVFL